MPPAPGPRQPGREIDPLPLQRLTPPGLDSVPLVAPGVLAGMIDPARSALLIIDVQADFASPTGAMARMGADLSGVPAALERIAELIAAARAAGTCLAFTRVITTADTEPGALQRLNARKGLGPEAIAICREGEPGGAYHQVEPLPGEIEVTKRLYSAFHETDLEVQLRARGVETLVVAGFTTHCCVDATCRDAFHRDFNVFVVADATDAYASETQLSALKVLYETCALVTDAASVLTAWSAAES